MGVARAPNSPGIHHFSTREVSCFEEARQVLLQDLDQINSPGLSELLGEDFQAEEEGEEGPWSPQTTRGSGEERVSLTAPGTGSGRRLESSALGCC